MGWPLASEVKMSHHLCNCCQKPESEQKFKQCKSCKAVRYCNEKCQETNWPDHKKICKAINELSSRAKSQNLENGFGDLKMTMFI